MTTLLTRPTPIGHHLGEAKQRPASFLNLALDSGTDAAGAVDRLSGLRSGRMVEIRFPMGDYESVTWVLAAAPRFETVLGAWSTLPAGIAEAIGDVPVFAPIWHGLLLRGSELGLVALRSPDSPLPHAFMHDLWILDRLADRLGLLPLPAGDLRHEPIPGGVRSAAPTRLAG